MALKNWSIRYAIPATVAGTVQNIVCNDVSLIAGIRIYSIQFSAFTRNAANALQSVDCKSVVTIGINAPNSKPAAQFPDFNFLGVVNTVFRPITKQLYFNSTGPNNVSQCLIELNAGDVLNISVENLFTSSVAVGNFVCGQIDFMYERV